MSSDAIPRRAVVLGGKTGMLGTALVAALRGSGWEVTASGRDDVDVTDSDRLGEYLEDIRPTHVLNAVAYTRVDDAEGDREAAFRLNASVPAAVGRLARELNFKPVHFSTDFIFDGSGERPYQPGDAAKPLSVYGETKLAGEDALVGAAPDGYVIIRTAWLFGPGRGNFIATILGLARERNELKVVHDQTGSPTYTLDLAQYTVALLEKGGTGLFHLVNSGQATWCELASEAVSLAGLNCKVQPIPSSEYPTRAVRPKYSVLDTTRFRNLTGVTPRPWVQALRDYVFANFGD